MNFMTIYFFDRKVRRGDLMDLKWYTNATGRWIYALMMLRVHVYINIYIYIYLVGGFRHFFIFHILGIVTPTDFHISQRGRSTTNQNMSNKANTYFGTGQNWRMGLPFYNTYVYLGMGQNLRGRGPQILVYF